MAPRKVLDAGEDRPAYSLCIWGGSREVLNRVLFSVSSELDARALWLEVACGDAGPYPARVPEELRSEPDRRYLCDRTEEIVPGRGALTLVLPGLIRPDERPETLTRVRAFLRLPSAVQEMISRVPEGERGRWLAVSNLDRVSGHFPQSTSDLKVILDAITSTAVSVAVAYTGTAPLPRAAFDFVFELRAPSNRTVHGAVLVCEKAPPGTPVSPGNVRPVAGVRNALWARRAG